MCCRQQAQPPQPRACTVRQPRGWILYVASPTPHPAPPRPSPPLPPRHIGPCWVHPAPPKSDNNLCTWFGLEVADIAGVRWYNAAEVVTVVCSGGEVAQTASTSCPRHPPTPGTQAQGQHSTHKTTHAQHTSSSVDRKFTKRPKTSCQCPFSNKGRPSRRLAFACFRVDASKDRRSSTQAARPDAAVPCIIKRGDSSVDVDSNA